MKSNLLYTAIMAAFATRMVPEDGGGQAAGGAVATPPAVAEKPKIAINFDRNYTAKPVAFHFKKDKKLGIKRPTVELQIPAATPDLLVQIMENGGKELDLLVEVVNDALINQARQQVNAKEDITQETFNPAEVNWKFLAELPPKERRGGGISKEDWADFQEDYVEVMPGLTGKNLEQVTNAAKLFTARLQPVKTNKLFLGKLKEQLNIWFDKSPNAEDYQDIYEFLDNKMTEFLKKDDAELLANI